jgi:hypothetical protein
MTETLCLDDQKLIRRVYDDLGRRNLLRDDMITLLVSRQDRDTGVALEIADVPPDPPQFERVQLTRPLLQRLVEQEDIDRAALVVCRPGGTEICGGDLAWHDAFAAACRVAGVRDCGTYVATARGAVGPIVPAPPG